MDYRWPLSGRRHGCLQALGSTGLARPQEACQPGHVLLAADVERVEVYSRSPDDFRHSSRERYGANCPAVHRRGIRVQAAHSVAVVVVGIDVREERQAGGRSDFEEGEGAGEGGEGGHQDSAARRLVGLRPPREDHAP